MSNKFLVKFAFFHTLTHLIITVTKILKSDWLSTALILALNGQFNRTVRVMPKSLDSTRNQARA